MLSHQLIKVGEIAFEKFKGRKFEKEDMALFQGFMEAARDLEVKKTEKIEKRTLRAISLADSLDEEIKATDFENAKLIEMSGRRRVRIEQYMLKRFEDDILLKTDEYHWLDLELTHDAIAWLVMSMQGELVSGNHASYWFKFMQRQDSLFHDFFIPVYILPWRSMVMWYTINPKYITFHKDRKPELTGIEVIDDALKCKINSLSC